MSKLRAGIVGTTGYTGSELAGLMSRHGAVELAWASSRSHAGESLDAVIAGAPPVPLVAPDAMDMGSVDVVFLCLPHAAAAPTALRALEAGAAVVDLSADFRLRDAATYERWYGLPHPAPELLDEAVYGLSEHVRGLLPRCRLVANPGCYPTSILLALGPLLADGRGAERVRGPIIADSKSGVSGAGRVPALHTQFVEVDGDFRAYKVGRSHRHLPEMEQLVAFWWAGDADRAGGAAGDRIARPSDADSVGPVRSPDDAVTGTPGTPVSGAAPDDLVGDRSAAPPPAMLFTPHLLPVPRGILSTIYVRLTEASADEAELRARYMRALEGEPFVSLLPAGREPSLSHVTRTNRCVIALDVVASHDGPMLLLRSAIDNLVKGAAGQAVQNMNLMLGLPETEGLR